jgi:membrane-associated phospholipid phosphatase
MHSLTVVVAKYFVFLAPLAWLIVLARLPKKQQLSFVVFSIYSAVFTALLVKLATTVHHDPRPFVRDHMTPYFKSSNDNGFPSDHTALTATIAFIVLRYNRWAGLALLVLAMLIGTTRVASNVHHGQDIVAGVVLAMLGTGAGLALEWAIRYFRKPSDSIAMQ